MHFFSVGRTFLIHSYTLHLTLLCQNKLHSIAVKAWLKMVKTDNTTVKNSFILINLLQLVYCQFMFAIETSLNNYIFET